MEWVVVAAAFVELGAGNTTRLKMFANSARIAIVFLFDPEHAGQGEVLLRVTLPPVIAE